MVEMEIMSKTRRTAHWLGLDVSKAKSNNQHNQPDDGQTEVSTRPRIKTACFILPLAKV